MTKGLLLFTILLFALPGAAYQIEGQLLERGTRKPLAEVNVFILPSKDKTITDNFGKFTFNVSDDLPESSIVINFSGYKKLEKQINKNQNEFLNLYLEKENYREFETVVTGIRKKRDENSKRLTAKEFLQTPGSDGDPIKAVQNLSGVARAAEGSARVIIQGGEPEDTGYLIDQHEVPLIFHFGGLSSIVIPEAVDSVDFYPAGFGPEFGRNKGGFVGLNTRSPKTDRTHSFVFADFVNAGGLIEGNIDENSSYLIGGRYSYISFFLAEIFKDNESASLTVAPSFQDLTSIYKRKLDGGAEFKVTFVQSEDKLEFLLKKSPSGDPYARGSFSSQTNFWRLIPQWQKKLDETTEVSLSSAIGSNGIRFEIDKDYLDIRTLVMTTRGEIIKKHSETWNGIYGFDNSYNWYNVATRIPSFVTKGGIANPIDSNNTKVVDAEGKISQIGLYWRNEIKISPNDPSEFIPSVRFDKLGLTKEIYFQPRFAYKYNFSDTMLLKAATGIYYQAPAPQQTDASFGNPDLGSERSTHYTLGFDQDLRGGSNIGTLLGGNIFYKKLENLIINSSRLVSRDGSIIPEIYNNDGVGNIKGFEFNYKYFESSWSTTVAYTYTKSVRQSPGEIELPSEYDQTHSLNFLGAYNDLNWTYGVRFRYVSGSPYTPIIGATFDSDNDVYFPIRGDIFSERKKPFSQLDFRADRKFIHDTEIWSIYIDIQNLLNTKNEESYVYSYDFKKKQAITGLPTIPSVGIKGEF